MLKVLQSFKESKGKKAKNEKKGPVKYEEVENIEKNGICSFWYVPKTSKRERKLTAANY